MSEKKEKKKLKERLNDKYRLTIYNDTSFEEVTTVILSRLNIFAYVGIFTILIGIITYLLLLYSPLKIFLPAYQNSELRRTIILNSIRVDSLVNEIALRDKYFENMRNIIEGKEISDIENDKDSATHYDEIDFNKSKEDSILRQQIENQELYTISAQTETKQSTALNAIHFFAPISKGLITNKFSIKTKHYAVDIVAAPNEGVKAVLDGTVIEAGWNMETGYSMTLQHENNILSLYKHNSALLKQTGDRVNAGEVIAIIGNSGELTTGPHLHFELWHNGVPLNPESYIVF